MLTLFRLQQNSRRLLMPIQTRRSRQQNNEPLSPIDLDPWNSNIELIQEQRQRVAQQNQHTNNSSPLTTPPSTPVENNSNMSEQGSPHSSRPSIAFNFNTTPDGTIERVRSRTASGMMQHGRHTPSPTHSNHRSSNHRSSSHHSLFSLSNKSLPTTPRTPCRSTSSNHLRTPIDLFQQEPSRKPVDEFRVQRFEKSDMRAHWRNVDERSESTAMLAYSLVRVDSAIFLSSSARCLIMLSTDSVVICAHSCLFWTLYHSGRFASSPPPAAQQAFIVCPRFLQFVQTLF